MTHTAVMSHLTTNMQITAVMSHLTTNMQIRFSRYINIVIRIFPAERSKATAWPETNLNAMYYVHCNISLKGRAKHYLRIVILCMLLYYKYRTKIVILYIE